MARSLQKLRTCHANVETWEFSHLRDNLHWSFGVRCDADVIAITRMRTKLFLANDHLFTGFAHWLSIPPEAPLLWHFLESFSPCVSSESCKGTESQVSIILGSSPTIHCQWKLSIAFTNAQAFQCFTWEFFFFGFLTLERKPMDAAVVQLSFRPILFSKKQYTREAKRRSLLEA